MNKRADETSMTAEASKTEATVRPAPAFRKPTQTRAGRLRQEMIAGYIAALGGSATAIQLQDIERAVDLIMLATTARAELAAGKTTINDVVKLEGASDRAIRRLGIKSGAAAAPGDDAWRKFLASQHAAPTDEGDG